MRGRPRDLPDFVLETPLAGLKGKNAFSDTAIFARVPILNLS
jgi:hypothetical protein